MESKATVGNLEKARAFPKILGAVYGYFIQVAQFLQDEACKWKVF